MCPREGRYTFTVPAVLGILVSGLRARLYSRAQMNRETMGGRLDADASAFPAPRQEGVW